MWRSLKTIAVALAALTVAGAATAQQVKPIGSQTPPMETRDGYIAWEYYFAYGTGRPPWVSGMTQATAVQALSRGYRAMGQTRWKRAAERALGAFRVHMTH